MKTRKAGDRLFVILQRHDGTPQQSWWAHQQSRAEFQSAAKVAAERMTKSVLGNISRPITDAAE